MSELVGPLGPSPELMATLADLDVRTLLQDPTNLRFVAAMLKQAADQARAMRQGHPPTSEPQAQAS